MTCACSAGPAFEGGGLTHGMRASTGAIDNVEIDPLTAIAKFNTIGDVKPLGICGSGMITLIAGLFLSGWLDPAGKLNRQKPSPAIQIQGRQARYIIAAAEQSGHGQDIDISESDIENLIRAKAAVYAATSLMLKQVDLQFSDLDKIYIAGGFGRFLDIDKAITIGLLPDIPREKFIYLGNSSLMGAYFVLISKEYREQQIKLAQRLTYLELNTSPAYMDQYTAALFLPHTDIHQFPGVAVLQNLH